MDQINAGFQRQEKIMAVTWIMMVAFIIFLKVLTLNGGKKNERGKKDK